MKKKTTHRQLKIGIGSYKVFALFVHDLSSEAPKGGKTNCVQIVRKIYIDTISTESDYECGESKATRFGSPCSELDSAEDESYFFSANDDPHLLIMFLSPPRDFLSPPHPKPPLATEVGIGLAVSLKYYQFTARPTHPVPTDI